MGSVTLKGIRKDFGKTSVIDGVDLTVESNALTVFVGPSGCGKSTLLRMIAGLETPTSGDILIDGERVNDTPPFERGVAMVFQSYALYPHMTVYENMRFGLSSLKLPKTEIDSRIAHATEMLDLKAYLARKPKELSGGQRQRVAMGRALVRQPKVFLLDEPLSNLDAALRVKMRLEIARFREKVNGTMIYVTHDQVEAMTLANKLVVLRNGKIEQEGPPIEVYKRPVNKFVAGFLGAPAMNFIPMKGKSLEMGIRAEHLHVKEGYPEHLHGNLYAVEHLGDHLLAHVTLDEQTPVVARLPVDTPLTPGSPIALGFNPSHCRYFDDKGNSVHAQS